MNTNIFKYLKFISIAAFSWAIMFSSAFGACAASLDLGTNSIVNVGNVTGLQTLSSDDTSAVNVKFAKYKSLFKTVNIRKFVDRRSFIDDVENTSASITFQAYPASYVAMFKKGGTVPTTGYVLGTHQELANRHAKMCALIDHVPAGTYPTTISGGLTPSPVAGNLESWNFYDWAKAWSNEKGIVDVIHGDNDNIYAFLDSAGASISNQYSFVKGTFYRGIDLHKKDLNYTTGNITSKTTEEGSKLPWDGLIGFGPQEKQALLDLKARHIQWGKDSNTTLNHEFTFMVGEGALEKPPHSFYQNPDDELASTSARGAYHNSLSSSGEFAHYWLGSTFVSPALGGLHSRLENLINAAYLLCEPKQ